MAVTIPCRVCGTGELQKTSVYRFGSIVAVIGWIILIPTLLGMALGLLMIVGMVFSDSAVQPARKAEHTQKLAAVGFESQVAEDIFNHKQLTVAERQKLTPEQRRVYDDVVLTYAGETIGRAGAKGIGFGSGICLMIGSFVGGLLGWILILKRKILKCTSCGAAIDAA